MKRFILAILFCTFMFVGFSQGLTVLKTAAGATSETLTNGDTVYLTHDGIIRTNKTFAVVASADTLTGSNAVITAIHEGSIDGEYWSIVGAEKTIIALGPEVYNSISWYYDNLFYPYNRVRIEQTGTATSTVRAKFYVKRN